MHLGNFYNIVNMRHENCSHSLLYIFGKNVQVVHQCSVFEEVISKCSAALVLVNDGGVEDRKGRTNKSVVPGSSCDTTIITSQTSD